MNKRISILLFALIAQIFVSVAFANGCGVAPNGVTSCIPINVVNTQSGATPWGFQQQLGNFPTNAEVGNFVIYNVGTGAQAPGWVESTNTVWFNMFANTISGSSSANGIWALGFCASCNFFASGNLIGEAPQLSATYAQYDTGYTTFNFYDNFNGITLGGEWTNPVPGGSMTLTVSNGVTFTITGGYNWVGPYTNAYSTINTIVDTYGHGSGTYATYGICGNGPDVYTESGGSPPATFYLNKGGSCTAGSASGDSSGGSQSTNLLGILTLVMQSGASAALYNYVSILTGTGTTSASGAVGFICGQGTGACYYQWFRDRLYPPSGVMPSVTYGSPQSNSGAILTFGSNPITYGTSTTVTATCTPGTDSCAVQAPIGTNLCSGTGSCTNTIPNYPAAGTYTYYANDLTATQKSSGVLTVNQAQSIASCSYASSPLTNGQTVVSIYSSAFVNCNVNSIPSNYLTGTFNYNGVNVAGPENAIAYNALWNDLTNTGNWIVAGDGNYLSNSLAFTLLDNVYKIQSCAPTSGPFYETQTKTFTCTLNITKAASSANFILYDGSSFDSNILESINPSVQTFSIPYIVPLAPTNNVQVTYNDLLQVTLQSGPVLAPQLVNTLTTNTLWNYIPIANALYSNTIFGENETINVTLQDLQSLGLAAYAGSVKIGTHAPIAESSSTHYNFFAFIYSFLASNFGITNPGAAGSKIITANAVVQLSYNNVSVYRNQSTTFVTTNETVSNCNALTGTNSINWNFYTLPSQAVYTGNVYIQGYFQTIKNAYQFNATAGSSAGFPTPGFATSNTYNTCIFPFWASGQSSFGVSGYYQYNASVYGQAHFYLVNQPISNTLTNVNLYLENVTSPELYSIAVENTTTSSYVAAYVQILQFIPNTNSSVLVNEIQTPNTGTGTAQTYLSIGTRYRYGVYSLTGQLLLLTNYQTAEACGSPPCLLIIYLNNANVTTQQQVLGNIKYSCTQINTNSSMLFQTNITCQWTNINGASYPFNLRISKSIFGSSSCNKNLSASSGSLTCIVNQTNVTRYLWAFQTTVFLQPTVLDNGQFGHQGALYGPLGALVTLIVILAVAGVVASQNIIASLTFADISFTVCSIIGLITVPLPVLGMLQVLTGILIWIVTR